MHLVKKGSGLIECGMGNGECGILISHGITQTHTDNQKKYPQTRLRPIKLPSPLCQATP